MPRANSVNKLRRDKLEGRHWSCKRKDGAMNRKTLAMRNIIKKDRLKYKLEWEFVKNE